MVGSRRERSIVRATAREGRILRPPGAPVRGGWAGILPLRGTVHEKGESLPVRGPFRRHDASFARHGPREGSIVRESRAEGESRPRPADPPEPRLTAPVKALSETDPPRSLSDAAASEDPATPHKPTRAQTHRPGQGPLGDRLDSQPQRRSSKREPSHTPQTHPAQSHRSGRGPFRRPPRLAATATQQQALTRPHEATKPDGSPEGREPTQRRCASNVREYRPRPSTSRSVTVRARVRASISTSPKNW